MQESLCAVAQLDDFAHHDHSLSLIQMQVNASLGRPYDLSDVIIAVSRQKSITPEKLI